MSRLGFLVAILAAPALLAATAEVHGRPLRGLSTVPIAEVTAHPERYRERALRVSGEVAETGGSRLVLTDGGASLPLEGDGSFALPSGVKGAKVTAEGKLLAGALVLVATGLEVRR